MPATAMLTLALALRSSLTTDLSPIVDEVNAAFEPDTPIVMPTAVTLGVRVEMIQRELSGLPALACGVYVREAVDEGEQEWSTLLFHYVIAAFIGGTDPDALYIQSQKWAIALDLWVERFASNLVEGLLAEEAADIDISYALSEIDGSYRHLISFNGTFKGSE